MFTLKMIFMICEVITGLMFIIAFGGRNTNTGGKILCSVGIIQFLIFIWIVASRAFF